MTTRKPKHHTKYNDQKYLYGTPTRAEVANYVNALLEEKYIPELKKLIMAVNAHSALSHQVVLALLLKKGICTEDEIKEITEEFIKRNVEGAKAKENPPTEKSSDTTSNDDTSTKS